MCKNQTSFDKQYNLSYITRLDRIKEFIVENPALNDYNLDLKNLSDDLNEECIVIGILFVDSKKKPSILINKDLQSDHYLEDCQFYIEDQHGRILLSFTDSFEKLRFYSTGMILGFVGYRNEKSVFVCSDVIFPKPMALGKHKSKANNSKILLMSNIALNDNNFEKVRMAIDYFSDTVNEIIIFGNIFTDKKNTFPNIEDFNQFLSSEYPKVHLVPNLNDPSSKMIPIEPLHKMLFKNGARNLDLLPHPAKVDLSGASIILMNNYIIEDLMKYTTQAISQLEVMKELLKIRYLAPNSPDTIASVPFFKEDPLIIDSCDYFIVGGTSKFEYETYRDVSLLTIPNFKVTQSVVVLDMATGQSEEIFFKL